MRAGGAVFGFFVRELGPPRLAEKKIATATARPRGARRRNHTMWCQDIRANKSFLFLFFLSPVGMAALPTLRRNCRCEGNRVRRPDRRAKKPRRRDGGLRTNPHPVTTSAKKIRASQPNICLQEGSRRPPVPCRRADGASAENDLRHPAGT